MRWAVSVVKDDAELADDITYTVVFADGEIDGLAEGSFTVLEITPLQVLSDYFTELGTFGKEDLRW